MRRYEYGDPAKVLERRGEDCTGCRWLGEWRIGGASVLSCDNISASARKREQAPDRRCDQWRHIKADGGQ